MTVVTQFPASGSSVTSIRRFYIQNGVRFESPTPLNIPGTTSNEINAAYCAAEEAEFGGTSFSKHGGLPQMSDALTKGMVLVMSVWDDVSNSSEDMELRQDDINIADSSASTCSGSTAHTPSTNPTSLVPSAALALLTLASPLMSGRALPTPRSSSPTSASDPLEGMHTTLILTSFDASC